MSTLHLRCQRNARLMLELASAECDEMCEDMSGDANNPDMDTIPVIMREIPCLHLRTTDAH